MLISGKWSRIKLRRRLFKMKLERFEKLIIEKVNEKILQIIKGYPEVSISAKTRAGAEISYWLEEKFVQYCKNDSYLTKVKKSSKEKTKNPWDIRTVFKIGDIEEEIWIDFKALKISSVGSNPDIGTPSKIIKFINKGSFYLLYVLVYYKESNDGLKFVEYQGSQVNSYYLKGINHTFRRNPKNQLQVQFNAPPEPRTRNKFIDLLLEKLKESYQRQINICQSKLLELNKIKKILKDKNNASETNLIKKLESIHE